MAIILKIAATLVLFIAVCIVNVFANEGEQELSPVMQKWWEEQKKINDDNTLTPQEKASSWIQIAKEYQNDEALATALFCSIFTLSGKELENKESILTYYKELMAIQSDKPLVIRWQKEVSGLPESIAANEKRLQDRITRILEDDNSFTQGKLIMDSWRELIRCKQLLPCIESIKNTSIRGKIAFAIYEFLPENEKINFENKFKPIIMSAGELGVKYFIAKSEKGTDGAPINSIRKEIWNVDNLNSDTIDLAFVRLSIGLSKNENFWPPFLSTGDKFVHDAHISQIEDSYQIVEKAIKYIAESKYVYYRKGKECSGAILALRLRAKLPLFKKSLSFYGKPLMTLNFLTRTTTDTISGALSPSHASHDAYKVKTDEGQIVNVYPWILKKLNLSEKERKLVKDSGYSSILK